MSEIQRFDPLRFHEHGIYIESEMYPCQDGSYTRYTDLLWYQRQYRMALGINIVVVLVCVVLAGYLVYHKHDPQSVAKKVPVVALESTSKLAGLIDRYKNAKGEVERVQVKKKNPQQVEVVTPVRWAESYTPVPVVSTKMHDGKIAQLAREVGFLKGVRVVE